MLIFSFQPHASAKAWIEADRGNGYNGPDEPTHQLDNNVQFLKPQFRPAGDNV